MNDGELDLIVQLCKENYKLSKALIKYLSNVSLDIEKSFKKVETQFDSIKEEIHKADKLRADDYHTYSDDELFKLKKSLSWKQLSIKTKIPLSTLQYRCRRYKEDAEKNTK